VSTKKEQGQYTHIVLLLDASTSMCGHENAVVRVVDQLVKEWTDQANALDDMTRLTVYQFSSQNYMPNGDFIDCLWYDTDIARIKSLQGKYRPNGNTALIDSTVRSLRELAQTPTMYGDHTFLFYSITDGGENYSRIHTAAELVKEIETLPDNWTVAALVPNINGKIAAQRFGFPAGNVMVWDATSERGVEEAGRAVAQATASYMGMRTNSGMRSTKSLFVGGQVDADAIKAAKLKPLASDDYAIVPVTPIQGLVQEKPDPTKKKPPAGQPDNRPMVSYMEIEPFISRVHPPFRVGKAYYELVKTEKIAGNKQLAIVDKNGKVYLGAGVRQMLGLPEENKTVKPDFNPDYKIYVQSTSLNRHLYLHSSVMVLTK
jgi:hypothetical protein